MLVCRAVGRALVRLPRALSVSSEVTRRTKFTQFTGVKGIRNRKFEQFEKAREEDGDDDNDTRAEGLNLEDREYDVIANTAMQIGRDANVDQNVFVIQPYIKWGAKKASVTPEHKLQEAEALVRSLPTWRIGLSMKVPLESLEKKTLFGTGKLEEIKTTLQRHRAKGKAITCLFVSKGTLSFVQKRFLESELGLPVLDRYSVVIQILRLHATSTEAKLQVAMAEIPYIWGQMKDANVSTSRKIGYSLSDAQRDILRNREKKLKTELENIREHRKLLRKRRKQQNYPIVAVVGYTNAGKTSLIKALTNEQKMQPRDQLFATLDVTAHAGYLPCNLEVIYMDTVGFMSDLPTGLIECFVATLEDAMMADVIIHVQDLSHENYLDQKSHVEETLESLTESLSSKEKFDLPPIINVGNKIDLVQNLSKFSEELDLVSSKTLNGVNELLLKIEKAVLKSTARRKLTIRARSGGPEMAWLYKNAAVTNTKADPKDSESVLIDVVITESKLQQFRHYLSKQ